MALTALAWLAAFVAAAGLAMTLANVRQFRRVRRTRDGPSRMSACIAMRDEEANAAQCVRSLLAQDALDRLVVCDDGSQDATTRVLREAFAADSRTLLLTGMDYGSKAAALAAAARHTGDDGGRFVLFTDADVRFGAGALNALGDTLHASGCNALTAWPRVAPEGIGDVLVTPAVTMLLMHALPMWRSAVDARCSAGNGQLLLIEREQYERCGGHASLGATVVEDVALARALARAGSPPVLACAADDVFVRGYGSIACAARGLGRSLFASAGAAGCVAFAVWQLLAFVMPFALLAAAPLPAAAGVCCALASRTIVAVRMREPASNVVVLPVAALVCAAAALAMALAGSRSRLVWRRREVRA